MRIEAGIVRIGVRNEEPNHCLYICSCDMANLSLKFPFKRQIGRLIGKVVSWIMRHLIFGVTR